MLWGGGGCVWPASQWLDFAARGADEDRMVWQAWHDLLPLLTEAVREC
jgi:hypothetical protein